MSRLENIINFNFGKCICLFGLYSIKPSYHDRKHTEIRPPSYVTGFLHDYMTLHDFYRNVYGGLVAGVGGGLKILQYNFQYDNVVYSLMKIDTFT